MKAHQSKLLKRHGFLPQAFTPWCKSLWSRFIGGCLWILAIGGLLICISYNPFDPSFNTASVNLPTNWLQGWGAYWADLLLQFFGIGNAIFFAGAIWWGQKILKTGLIYCKLRYTLAFLITLMVGCSYASLWPQPRSWPLRCGLGGVVGDLLVLQILGWGTVSLATLRWLGTLPLLCIGGRLLWRNLKPFNFTGTLRLFQKPQVIESTNNPELPKFPKTLETTPESKEIINTPHSLATESFHLPSLNFLEKSKASGRSPLRKETIDALTQQLQEVLAEFGVNGEIMAALPGPVVTLYELKPAPGIKTSRVISLADDIARSMSAVSVRVAVIPGRNVIGIELPNPIRQTVYLHDLLQSPGYQEPSMALPLALGKDIAGNPIIADLARMPHLLVAGTTGSGKSVSINTMILSLLYRLSPENCRLIMIDPKMLELSVYEGIPHLLTPVVTEPKKAVVALKWAVKEMENRYRLMARLGVRNIDGYNTRLGEAKTSGELLARRVQTGFDPDSGKPIFESQPLATELLPYIVVVVDEMADLMLVAGKEIEATVQRLAQMARAAGIHLIMATQRPSVDVITGTIKANFPTRISFQVTSKIDSRTILGEQGAEQLLGQGDMLYMQGGGRITRVHGAFCHDMDVERVVEFLQQQGEPTYIEAITVDAEENEEAGGKDAAASDELYQEAVALVLREGKASTSFIQRHLQIGYNRAARIIEMMEKQGMVSPANYAGKREIMTG